MRKRDHETHEIHEKKRGNGITDLQKTVAVIIRKSPFNTSRNAEALRMSVGLTLVDNQVHVIFVSDAVYLLRRTSSGIIDVLDVSKHLEYICTLGQRLIVESEALDERDIPADGIAYDVEVRSRREIADIIAESDIVIAY